MDRPELLGVRPVRKFIYAAQASGEIPLSSGIVTADLPAFPIAKCRADTSLGGSRPYCARQGVLDRGVTVMQPSRQPGVEIPTAGGSPHSVLADTGYVNTEALGELQQRGVEP